MNLFKLVGSIFIDNEKANDSISKTDTKAEKLAKKFVEGAVTAAKWGAGITTAAAGMATAVGAAVVKVAEDTREYRNEMGKLDTAFESTNFSADTARNTYKSLQAILGDTGQAVEASNHLAELCDTEEELVKWTQICTGVYGKFGNSLPIEGLTEAANETAKVGQVTGPLADALNWVSLSAEDLGLKLRANTEVNKEWNDAIRNGAAAEDLLNMALSECSSEQERQQLITKTLSGVYSEIGEKYKENNEDVIRANEAQEKLNDTMARIGEKLDPIVTNIKLYGATLLESAIPAITNFITENDAATVAVDFLKAAIGLLKDGYSELLEFINWISEAWENTIEWGKQHETLLTVIAIAVGTLTTAILAYNSAKIVKKALDIAETAQIYLMIAAENAHTLTTTIATGATTAFGAAIAFLTSPITLVIAAIGALIAIGVALYKNWDEVSEKASQVWNAMKDSIGRALEVAKENVKDAIDKIKSFFDFKWSLPKIELPHFTIKGKFSLDPPSIPKIGVSWYEKAMNRAMILNSPTIFGYSNASGKLLGGGEGNGPEVVAGQDTLLNMIRTVMADENLLLVEKLDVLISMLGEYLSALLSVASPEIIVQIGNKEFKGYIVKTASEGISAAQMDILKGKGIK